MLDCRKLRRQQPAAAVRGTKVGYMHPDEAEARRRRGLFVSGTRAVTAYDAEGSEHTVYVLRCSYIEDGARVSWEVRRRYNDFFTLHTKLKRYGAVVAELPSRNPFAKLSSVVRSREVGLQEYLQAVLSHCNDQQCSYLAKFLQVQKNLPSYHRLWPPLPEGESTVHTKEGPRPAQAQGHRADHSTKNDEQRGRSAESESVNTTRVRAKSMPRAFGKRSRPLVDGVPRSSLYSRDDASVEFSRVFKAQGTAEHGDVNSSDDDAPQFSSVSAFWEAGTRRQARVAEVVECGVCGGDDLGVAAAGIAEIALAPIVTGRSQIGESTARQQLKILHQLRMKREHEQQGTHAFAGNSAGEAGGQRETEMAELVGIGLYFVQVDSSLCAVDEIVAGGAAESSGRIQVGDVLLSVDGQGVGGMELAQIRQLIIGRPGTAVTLDFSRKVPALSDDESVSVMRPRLRSRALRSDDEEIETQFVVCLVRAVPLHSHDNDHSDECPSTALGDLKPRVVDHSVAAAAPLSLSCNRAPAGRSQAGSSSAQGKGSVKLVTHKGDVLSHSSKAEREVEGDSASDSSAQSLSHRSTVLASLSNQNSSGEDDCGGRGGIAAQGSAPATPIDSAKAPASVDEVCAWLYEIELGEYVTVFHANKIDFQMLQDLEEEDLLADFGMTNKYHRRRLLSKRAMCVVPQKPAAPLSALSAATTASPSAPNSSSFTPVQHLTKELEESNLGGVEMGRS